METKRFRMLDESFSCLVCNHQVEPLKYTARDHCPFCLYSIHIDNLPGDRQNPCHGLLQPIDIEQKRGELKIIYKCNKCGQIKKNKVAQDDNYDLILKISANKDIN